MKIIKDKLLVLLDQNFNNNKQKFIVSLRSGKQYKELRTDIINLTTFLVTPSFSQRIFHIFSDTYEIPKCYCGNFLSFFDLSKGYNLYCSPKCKYSSAELKVKIEKTNLERYGTKAPGMNQEVKNKIKRTNLEKYGFESHNSSDVVKEKKKKVCLERYGVENVSQMDFVKEKIKGTFLEKYGETWLSKSNIIKEKVKQTNLKKFGYTYPAQSPEIRKKLHDIITSPEVVEKTKQTNLKRYGVENSSQSEIIKNNQRIENFNKLMKNVKILQKVVPLFNVDDYNGIDQQYSFLCKVCNSEIFSHLKYGQIPRCMKCYPLQSISILEKEIVGYLTSIGIQVTENNREIISPYELDIYIPDYKLAIEFNGLYWHSELNGKDQKYHLDKTEKCLEKGIQLIHIFEDEWLYKQEIVKSIISSKLGLNKKSFARTSYFQEIDKNLGSKFFTENHLQGNNTKITNYYALSENEELIYCIGIGKSRYNKNYDYELIRSCSKLNTVVIGGFEKLIKNLPLQGSIISYVDRRYFNGNSYNYWKYIGKTNPNYFYMFDHLQRFSRIEFQKHKLFKLFPDVYEDSLTEWQNMQLVGYDRIWDCGNLIFSRKL